MDVVLDGWREGRSKFNYSVVEKLFGVRFEGIR